MGKWERIPDIILVTCACYVTYVQYVLSLSTTYNRRCQWLAAGLLITTTISRCYSQQQIPLASVSHSQKLDVSMLNGSDHNLTTR